MEKKSLDFGLECCTLWHVLEKVVTGKVDVVDDLAQVFVEVVAGKSDQVVQGLLGNVPLPLQLA